MIITKTPFRMSFFGGGTDMESFFREYGGAVLSTTFDKYCYVNVRHLPPFFSYATELSYAKTERVNSLEEIEHPAIRNAMKMLDMHHIRLTYEADLPARSGLGTSSSFAVGMLNAFYALKGQYASKEKLAKEAIYLERVLCAEVGGWQDQIAAAFGGFNRIDFSADGYEVRPVLLSPERKRRLNGRLMMFFTGFTRFSAEIQQLNNSRNGADKLARLQEMLALVDEAEAILTDEQADLNEFGRLLDHTWKLKRGTGVAVSTDCIDALYARGIAAGALGGKLLGAGGGGFLVFYVEPEHQAAVRQQRLRELSAIGRRGNLRVCAEYQLFAVMPLFPRSSFTHRQAAMRTDHPQRGNRFEALRGMRQHVCGGQQPGEILPRLRGKDTPQTESPKREKQAFTDKNNYIASTANEYPFARNARAALWEARAFCLLG